MHRFFELFFLFTAMFDGDLAAELSGREDVADIQSEHGEVDENGEHEKDEDNAEDEIDEENDGDEASEEDGESEQPEEEGEVNSNVQKRIDQLTAKIKGRDEEIEELRRTVEELKNPKKDYNSERNKAMDKIESLKQERKELRKKLKDGDISDDQFDSRLDAIDAEIEDLKSNKSKAEFRQYEERKRQVQVFKQERDANFLQAVNRLQISGLITDEGKLNPDNVYFKKMSELYEKNKTRNTNVFEERNGEIVFEEMNKKYHGEYGFVGLLFDAIEAVDGSKTNNSKTAATKKAAIKKQKMKADVSSSGRAPIPTGIKESLSILDKKMSEAYKDEDMVQFTVLRNQKEALLEKMKGK